MSSSPSFSGADLDTYLLGLVLRRAIRRCDLDIFKLVRWLDRYKKVRALSPAGPGRPRPLTDLVYFLSPWMWKHRCLYETLFYYLGSGGAVTINVGLAIGYSKRKLGHCWASDGRENLTGSGEDAGYYVQPFAQRRNVRYWLPAAAGELPKQPRLLPSPRPERLKLRAAEKKTVTLTALNIRGYYAPALYLLRDYALRDPAISSRYSFRLIDEEIFFIPPQMDYRLTWRERFACLALMLRRTGRRKVRYWLKAELLPLLPHGSFFWWRAFLRVLCTRPDVAGFSCNIWNLDATLRMARLLKRVFPDTVVVLGGQEVTNGGAQFLAEHPYLDFIVDGEGEETFREFLRRLAEAGKDAVRGAPGLAGRLDAQQAKRPPIEDVARIPSPFSGMRGDERMLRKVRRSRLGCMVETARGCPFRCSFCFEAEKFGDVRRYPLSRVAGDITGMSLLGVRKFHILDPVLCSADAGRLKGLCEILRQTAELAPCEFSGEVYAEFLTEDHRELLDFFYSVDVGLQTTNPQVLRNINRYFDDGKFRRGVGLLLQAGKRFIIFLIFGLPGETSYSFIKSLRYVLLLKPPALVVNHLCLLRGTPLRRDAGRWRMSFDPRPPYYVKSTGAMSAADVTRCRHLGISLMHEYEAALEDDHAVL